MQLVGFTTGSLYKSRLSMKKVLELYLEAGANAVELSLATPEELSNFKLDEEMLSLLNKFDFVSIHAPMKDMTYKDDKKTRKVIEQLRRICDKISIRGLVLHPNIIEDFDILNDSNLPFLIENMDHKKNVGTTVEEFKEYYEKYDFDFVLDLQHSYEYDPSMKLAKEFLLAMADRLHHLHVSGQDSIERRHVLTYRAKNREAIERALKLQIHVPKILEGFLEEPDLEDLKKEIQYVRQF